MRRRVAALAIAVGSLLGTSAVTAPAASANHAASGIIGHNCTQYANGLHQDVSTFRPNYTDQYWVRVAYYDSSGVRLYLSPYYDKGGLNHYQTASFTFNYTNSRVARALVIWRAVNQELVWNDWDYC